MTAIKRRICTNNDCPLNKSRGCATHISSFKNKKVTDKQKNLKSTDIKCFIPMIKGSTLRQCMYYMPEVKNEN